MTRYSGFDSLSDEKIEKMMRILDADYKADYDITEAMMRKINYLELELLELRGHIALLEYKYALSSKV